MKWGRLSYSIYVALVGLLVIVVGIVKDKPGAVIVGVLVAVFGAYRAWSRPRPKENAKEPLSYH